jgi:hypothetical protein
VQPVVHTQVLLVESTQRNPVNMAIFQSMRPVSHYKRQPWQIRLRHMRVHYRLHCSLSKLSTVHSLLEKFTNTIIDDLLHTYTLHFYFEDSDDFVCYLMKQKQTK